MKIVLGLIGILLTLVGGLSFLAALCWFPIGLISGFSPLTFQQVPFALLGGIACLTVGGMLWAKFLRKES